MAADRPPDPSTPGTVPARPLLRFAPSPNGLLHLGHAYSILMNDRLARRLGGTLQLRFEDIDAARCRPAFGAAIADDIAWLGVRWQPPAWRQSERFPAYHAALARLADDTLLYPCFCTRGDIARATGDDPAWPLDPDGAPLYPGICRHRTPDEREALMARGVPFGLRLDMARSLARCPADLGWIEYREGAVAEHVPAEAARWGDALLARKDVPTSYHVSVVVDDAAQGIDHVVRGEDLFPSTGLHRMLQHLLGFAAPVYHHHRLIRDAAGEKLSKSRNAPTLQALRTGGTTPDAVRRQLGFV